MTRTIRITDAQMTALETAGIFDVPEGDEILLADAICGNRLSLTSNADQIARVICDLSNDADNLAHSNDLHGEHLAWANKDARVLANLYGTVLRAAYAN